jgi:phosphoglycerate dehydrogenase-like enzyme
MKKKIFLLGFNNNQINFIKKKFVNTYFFYNEKLFLKNIYDCDAVISITREKIDNYLPKINFFKNHKIKWIHLPGAGIDNYGIIKEIKGIVFTNGKIIQGIEVADHAMALLLSITRNISFINKFGQNKSFYYRPIELRGKKALIFGYGGIGRCLAERAFGFGLKLKVVNSFYSPYSNFIEKFYLNEQFNDAIKDTDILFITSPLKSDTINIINESVIKKLNPNSIIINVSRGKILCIKSLIKYIKNKHLMGAGLDVTDPEPLKKNHPLNKFSNVIITPHIAGISDNLSNRTFKLILNNLKRFSSNKKLINEIDINSEL